MNPEVDAVVARATSWSDAMSALRPILLRSGLTEEVKWDKPCYSHGGKNIAIVQEMKDFLALMFFKGALLEDPEAILEQQGPNSRSARRMRFTTSQQVTGLADIIEAYVAAAIRVEEAGLTVGPAPEPELAEELQARLDEDPAFRAAFESLTPGRRREYNLYVAGAKQAKTREERVERQLPRIMSGKGLRDR